MMSQSSPTPLDLEIEELNAWVATTTFRRTGHHTSLSSDRARKSRLRSLCALEGVCSLASLATHLEDRANMEACYNRLWAKYAPGTIRAFVDAIAVLGRYALGQGWIVQMPTVPGDRPTAPQKPIEVYDPEDIELLLRLAKNADLRWWAFLCTIVDTGRRVSEVLGLEWAQLHLDAKPPHFFMPTSKNKRMQYVPLSKRLVTEVFTPANIERLQAQKPRRHEQFHRDQAVMVFPYGYSTVQKRLQRDCKRLGITYRGFHNFRHTKATEMLANGVPLQAVAALLGHSSVSTTDRVYNHTNALSYSDYVD